MEDLSLQFAVEIRVVFMEEVVDGDLVSSLEQSVGVISLPPQLVSQAFGGSGLARAHVPDEVDSHVVSRGLFAFAVVVELLL